MPVSQLSCLSALWGLALLVLPLTALGPWDDGREFERAVRCAGAAVSLPSTVCCVWTNWCGLVVVHRVDTVVRGWRSAARGRGASQRARSLDLTLSTPLPLTRCTCALRGTCSSAGRYIYNIRSRPPIEKNIREEKKSSHESMISHDTSIHVSCPV